jgi:hypothetical protein
MVSGPDDEGNRTRAARHVARDLLKWADAIERERHLVLSPEDVAGLEEEVSLLRYSVMEAVGRVSRLRCVECREEDGGGAVGWRAYRTDDEVVVLCPDCAQHEFPEEYRRG